MRNAPGRGTVPPLRLLACAFACALLFSQVPQGRNFDLCPRLQKLLGVPYVEDAVLDERGRWTSFAHPETELPEPGLNLSLIHI